MPKGIYRCRICNKAVHINDCSKFDGATTLCMSYAMWLVSRLKTTFDSKEVVYGYVFGRALSAVVRDCVRQRADTHHLDFLNFKNADLSGQQLLDMRQAFATGR